MRQGIVPIFAKAGPKAIVLVATGAKGLEATEQAIHKINGAIKTLRCSVDISSSSSVAKLFEDVKSAFGHADVLVNNAAANEGGGMMAEQDDDQFWRNFEVNTKGTFLLNKYFIAALPSPETRGHIVTLVTGGAWLIIPNMAGYSLSKLAALQTTTYFAAQYPNITAISLHPGLVPGAMTRPEFKHFEPDTPELVGGISLWLASDEAHFLSGRVVTSNWDVEDLVARKDEIVGKGLLQMQLAGTFGKEQFD
jgi:NAD(P)-dependent dehydrogenase (short-subunit alcohol dehydrogenase family)